ncbi:MAG: hypothetical protein IAF58_15265 [Leptolyngbya sp.]|nr:hypothetical protein [Candidatus Melainabacteria bacterium]
MKKISTLTLTTLLALTISSPAFAQASQGYGDSGVITGDDPRSFFGSGAVIDPDAMEDASVPVDRATHLDSEYPGQKQIYPTIGTRGASTESIQLPNRPNVSPQQTAQVVATPQQAAANQAAANTYKYDMQQQPQQNGSQNQQKPKRAGFLKWYAQSWKHFALSTGNILGFPVGTDDDGTGDLKPPDMYGNN